MKIKTFLIILNIGLVSCAYDPPRPCVEINNQSGNNAIIEIHFDSTAYKKNHSNSDLKKFLTERFGYTSDGQDVDFVSFDTKALTQQYSISPNSTYCIEGWGDNGFGVLYDKIIIIRDNDTIVYNGLEMIKKSFKRVNSRKNRLEIK